MSKNPDKNTGRKAILHSIRFKLNFSVVFAGTVLMLISLLMLSRSSFLVESDLMDSRLKSDIAYLRDELTDSGEERWSIKDGALYLNDIMIGDGTMENAQPETFQHYEDITGTFFYVFMRTYNDDELSYVEDGDYMQGHYIRAVGTTRGPRGERIEGTYIDKKVADALEASEDGTFSGEANVNGRPIYCRYELLKNEDGENIGIISDGRSVAEMKSIVQKQSIKGTAFIVLATAAVYFVLSRLAGKMIRAIGKINGRLENIGKGSFSETPLELNRNDEFDDIAECINGMEASLAEKERIEKELNEKKFDLQTAAVIQSSMLPAGSDASGDERFSVYASMTPAKEVGGDFYDRYLIDEDHLAFTVADVSGKGIPASLFMMRAITTIRNFARMGLPLDEVFRRANESLCEYNEEQYFVTAWMGVLDLRSGILEFVDAGHNPPVLKREGSAGVINTKKNIPLGIMEGIKFGGASTELKPGDTVFVYTDGVTEAKRADNGMFTDKRLLDCVKEAPDDAEKLCKAVLGAVEEFSKDTEQFDDITMLAVRFN